MQPDKPGHMPESLFEEIPYGQRVADDCKHLTDNPSEMEIVLSIYEKVVAGWRPTDIASELNVRGYRTRGGSLWTATMVFDLLPRLIQLSPKLQSRPDWPSLRAKIEVIK